MKARQQRQTSISIATAQNREDIYSMRHAVYAEELGQHATNERASLSDPLDESNEYIVARVDGVLAGFISVTSPACGRYSIEKYVSRDEVPVAFDEGLFELRVLTVSQQHRNGWLAAALMYAGFRWAEERGATQYVAMGRQEVVGLYLKQGFSSLGREISCGSVKFDLLQAKQSCLRRFVDSHEIFYQRMLAGLSWDMDFPFFKAPKCFHGGAFFEAVGADFDTLERRWDIVSADVLDAWFPAAPRVLDTLQAHMAWLLGTSPPTHCEGMRAAIAKHRGVAQENILPGAGSSDLIFLAFQQWLTRHSRVLILDPMYGEYAHILEEVIGCEVDRLDLSRSSGYALDLAELEDCITARAYDMVVLVNPNNPTGRHVPRARLERLLSRVPKTTRVWVDEAYLEYVGTGESLEQFAAQSENVIVCKTMSKVYALSGARAGYLCAASHQLAGLVSKTPPWSVGLVAQVAAVRALESDSYYAARYRETHRLRDELMHGLRALGISEIVPSVANFVLFHLEPEHPTAAEVVKTCREHGVFLRNVSRMGTKLGTRTLRTAVKDSETNKRILQTLKLALQVEASAAEMVAEEELAAVAAD